MAISDRGSISVERLDRSDPRAAQLRGDIGFRALRGDFRSIDASGRAERPPQDHARHVGYFHPAALAPLDAGEERDQLIEALGPAQGVAMLEQREQTRCTQRASALYRLAVPPSEQGKIAAIAGRLETLAQCARRLDGRRAENDQSETRRESQPLGVRALECADAERLGLAPRFALVVFGAPSVQATRALSERFKAPGDCRDLALLARRHGEAIKRARTLGAPGLLALLEHCDALRRPERFDELVALLACVERGERGWVEIPYMPRVVLRRALGAATGVDAAKIAAQSAKSDIAAKLRRARIAAIEALD